MTLTESAIIAEIRKSPNDPLPWLIYADHLEESGQGPAADKVREMAGQLPITIHNGIGYKWAFLSCGRFQGQYDMTSRKWGREIELEINTGGKFATVWKSKVGTQGHQIESLIPLAILHHAGLAWDVDPPAAGG